MKKLLTLFLSFLLLSVFGVQPASAADVRAGDEVIIPPQTTNLRDLYLFGGTIRVDAPVTNDLVAGGGDVFINQPVTGSIMVGGGDITINGAVGNTLRAAGGNIEINAPITRDLVVSGGSITITQNASVGGDMLFAGGDLQLDGPVQGKATFKGGEVVINSTINGNVDAEVDKLTLGPDARINGNLTYESKNNAQIAQGAAVAGQTKHQPREEHRGDNKGWAAAWTGGAIYKLITDILISILFIFFFARGITAVLSRMRTNAVQSGAIGFGFIFLFPIVAFMCFILIWLGMAALLAYGLIFLIGLFLVKIFLGWVVMRWWQNRSRKQYVLDWRAGLIGPIVLFILAAIPFIGWITAAVIMFVATGALLYELISVIRNQKPAPKKALAKKN